MSKAIISISDWETTTNDLRDIAKDIDAMKALPDADYHLNFASPTRLFSDLTPKRLELLYHLKHQGPLSVYRLAKDTARNYSNVHADITRLLELELVEKDIKGRIFVPWEDIEIHASLNASVKSVA